MLCASAATSCPPTSLIDHLINQYIVAITRLHHYYLPRLLDYIITTCPVYSITSLLPTPFTRLHHYYLPRLETSTIRYTNRLLHCIQAPGHLCCCTCALHLHLRSAPLHPGTRPPKRLFSAAGRCHDLKKSTSEDTLESMMMVHKNL